jgi:hypothetical protein
MEYKTFRADQFDMKSHAASIMLPNGEAFETSCEGWDHGDHILEKMRSLNFDGCEGKEDSQIAFEKADDCGTGEAWSIESLLNSISNPDDPDGTPLRPTQNDINKLPQGFAPPLGLEDIRAIYKYFRLETTPSTESSPSPEEKPSSDAALENRRQLKRKRSSRNSRHKTELSKLKEQDPQRFKATKNALNRRKRLTKRRDKLPSTDSPLIQRHASNMTVVPRQINSLNLDHSKPGWIGTQRIVPSQGILPIPIQAQPNIDVDPLWNEEVKLHVKNGWQYIKNDIE